MSFKTAATILAVISAITPALAGEVPSNLIGHWALDGACGRADKSIHIEATTLAFGTEKGDAIEFMANDSPHGNGAIHWSEEGVVDNFEFDPTKDVLLHNTEGYGMGSASAPEIYKRCKA